ncbi:hypothetical protein WJX72_000001 [[Myrmecia] bisecta]|uniref:C2H2-type domain-containing protein n=1 Tax=[Myrmecia] bisecta TaxID=41462 RepID=A0AAW1Q689_9CHLO
MTGDGRLAADADSCISTVCLKHRFPADHQCKDRAAAAAQARTGHMAQAVKHMFGFGSKPAAATAKTAPAKAAARPAATAPQRQTPAALAAQQRAQAAAPTAQASGGGQEVCPQCSARFASLQELIYHAEVFHSQGPPLAAVEACPQCGQTFSDPVALVAHVERQHADSKTTCVLS